MNRINLRQAINLLAVIATIAVNGLAEALPINGLSTATISDRFQVYFVPAGYVFSIWGLIYLGLLGYALYQALPSQSNNPRLRLIGYLPALSAVFNIAWIFLWHYELIPLSLLAMLGLLITLIIIYWRLDIGQTDFAAAEKWLLQVPFSIYLAWITVATVANVTVALNYLQWNGWGVSSEAWGVIMLVVAGVIATAVSLTRGDIGYMAVIVWAFAGIAVKQAATPVVAYTAWGMAALMILVLLAGARIHRRIPPLLPA
ncbi:MAG: tryptophan-rich sensory protein [Chloroflexi bacterium]|nr:tryptophan-rich sensory protein [Chloroflexota bacterium]